MQPHAIEPGLALAERLFDRLRESSLDPPGVTRDADGAGEEQAHSICIEICIEAARGFAGNTCAALPGADRTARTLPIGSVRAGCAPGRDATAMAIRAEEAGPWFPTCYPGSHGALGRLAPEEFELRRQDSGRMLAERMAEASA